MFKKRETEYQSCSGFGATGFVYDGSCETRYQFGHASMSAITFGNGRWMRIDEIDTCPDHCRDFASPEEAKRQKQEKYHPMKIVFELRSCILRDTCTTALTLQNISHS